MTIHPRSVLVPYPHEPQSRSDERSGSHRGCGAQQSKSPDCIAARYPCACRSRAEHRSASATSRSPSTLASAQKNRSADGFCGSRIVAWYGRDRMPIPVTQRRRQEPITKEPTIAYCLHELPCDCIAEPTALVDVFEKEAGHRTLGQKNESRRRNQALLGVAFQIGQIVQQLPVTVARVQGQQRSIELASAFDADAVAAPDIHWRKRKAEESSGPTPPRNTSPNHGPGRGASGRGC